MEDYVKVYKKYPPYKEWLKTYKPPVRTESQKKIIKERFREKLKKELDNLVQKSTEDYTLFLKWNEIKELQGGTKKKFSNKDINWVKKLIWKPKDSKNYRGDFRRIYPELILCGNDFEVAGKDIFNNDVTFDYGEKDDLTLHWNILRVIVSKARHDGVVGRQFRYLVRDRDTKKYLGIICLSSDFLDATERNKSVQLPKNLRTFNTFGLAFNNTCNGQTIVPTQPFGKYFLGGKLLALLCLSKEVGNQWKKIYGDTLIGVTTTSLYGNKNKQTQYDGLNPYWTSCGSTTGNVPFKMYRETEKEIEKFLYENYPEQYWGFFVKHTRDFKKSSYRFMLGKLKLPLFSYQPRGLYYSRLYKESDQYFRNIVKTFKNVCIDEGVYKETKDKKGRVKGIKLVKSSQITDSLKEKLQKKTLERLKEIQTADDKLTPNFDNSIGSLVNFWKFGRKGDTTKLPPNISEETIKRQGKQNLQKYEGMVKGQVDTNREKFNQEIQSSGKGYDTYDEIWKYTWKEVLEKYS
jgi:hypothetical protein